MTNRTARTAAEDSRRRPARLTLCGIAAAVVASYAAADFSRPPRLGRQQQARGRELRVADRAGDGDVAKMGTFAQGRTGYVVWESRRPTGTRELKYRIWKRNLDGTGLTMVSGQRFRSGYAHLGPRISPDGRFVIYAGRRWDSENADRETEVLFDGAYAAGPFDAWLVEIDPDTLRAGRPRELTSLRGILGTAGSDRFFAWKDCRTVYVNVPGQNGIFEVDVVAGRIGARVVEDVNGDFLLSPSGKWLFRASPGGVAVVDLVAGLTAQKPGKARALPGCQAVMTCPDDVLVWMQVPGKVGMLDLQGSGANSVEPGAARSPGLRDALRDAYGPYHYAYFPSLSRAGNVLAFGASRFPPSICGETSYQPWLRHSHKAADYEIFLVSLNPETGAPVGEPVRYSFNDHSMYPELLRSEVTQGELRRGHVLDRFPDVWVRDAASDPVDARPSIAEGSGPQATLARAKALETVEPKNALALYEQLAKELSGTPTGQAAAARAAALQSDPRFLDELQAWEVLERMRKYESIMRATLGGVKGLRRNAQVAAACRGEIARIRAGYAELLSRRSTTRAMLEARQMVRRWEIDVPRETPASRKVVAVVEAVCVRASKPKTRKEIHPYTQAFMTAEFDVRTTSTGGLEERRFVAVLMSMNGGRDLPPASLKPGAVRQLRLGAWADQKHLHSHKLADDIIELDAPYYFVFPDRAGRPPLRR
jgi:hypothetical protein